MTLQDYVNRGIPEYYDTMYLDGFTPEQILQAAHNTFISEAEDEAGEPPAIQIVSQVKYK